MVFAGIIIGTIGIGYIIGNIFGKIPTLIGMLMGAILGLIMVIYLGMWIVKCYSKENKF